MHAKADRNRTADVLSRMLDRAAWQQDQHFGGIQLTDLLQLSLDDARSLLSEHVTVSLVCHVGDCVTLAAARTADGSRVGRLVLSTRSGRDQKGTPYTAEDAERMRAAIQVILNGALRTSDDLDALNQALGIAAWQCASGCGERFITHAEAEAHERHCRGGDRTRPAG